MAAHRFLLDRRTEVVRRTVAQRLRSVRQAASAEEVDSRAAAERRVAGKAESEK